MGDLIIIFLVVVFGSAIFKAKALLSGIAFYCVASFALQYLSKISK